MSVFRNTALATLVAACPAVFAAVPFDMNNDGQFTAMDVNGAATILSSAIQQGGQPLPPNMPPGVSPPGNFNGDNVLNLLDWTALIDYVTVVQGPRILFDVHATGALDARARMDIASSIQMASQSPCCVKLRYDFNGDGQTNLKDWALFTNYLRQSKPALLVDFNADNRATGADLDMMGRAMDMKSYDIQFDLNADGKLDLLDWQIAITLLKNTAPRVVFDVDSAGALTAVLNNVDAKRIANELNAISTGWRPSQRFDFNADGVVNALDWTEWASFAMNTIRTPDLLFDIDGNAVVNIMDLNHLQMGYQSRPMLFQFDLNGDRVSDARDVALMRSRLAYGGPVFAVGDVNRDGCVDTTDVALIQGAQGQANGMAGYDASLDVNKNNIIDMVDVHMTQSTPMFPTCR